jgi:hypothetical protein
MGSRYLSTFGAWEEEDMNLLESLLSTSLERAQGIANFYGIARDSIGEKQTEKEHLAKSISQHLLVPANLVVAVRGLNQEELLALRLITLAGGGNGVIIEQCHQKLNQLSRKWRRNCAKIIEVLISRGLVYTKREGYRHIYFVPEDLTRVLGGFFLEDIFNQVSVKQERFTPRNAGDFAAPLRHLCLLLSYIRKNQVKITQNGTIFKTAQRDLAVLLDEPESPMEESLFPLKYAPHLALLLHFAKSKSLIEERSGMLSLTENISEFLKLDYKIWRQELFNFWRQNFIAQDTDLQTLLWILVQAPKNTVVSLQALLSEMNTLSTSHASQGLPLRIERNLINPLEYLGVVQISRVKNATLVRSTDVGKALIGISEWPPETFDESFYVQSNFEILVPCTMSPQILWNLDGFAELQKSDQMMVYKINKNSVYRALLHNYTPATINGFLEKYSKTPIAQNITYSISQWGTSYGRIEFQEAILLKCDTKELAEELTMSPKIRPFIKEQIGPCYLVIKKEGYDELTQILSAQGYMPKVQT